VQTRIGEAIGNEQVGQRFDVLVEGLSQKQLKASGLSNAARKPRTIEVTIGGSAVATAPVLDHADEVAGPVQVTGRSDGDLIIHFDVPDAAHARSLIGRIVPVVVESASGLSLGGRIVHE
jgi:hypothetical protein